jgi:SSS family transporter
MNWLNEHWLQLLLVVGYFWMLVHHALVGSKESGTAAGYLVAGRNLGGVVVALSFYATFMSTNTFIGASGKSWDSGIAWCVGGVILSALALLSWIVVAPKFVPLTREYKSLTVADFLGTHYSSNVVRRFAGCIVAFSSVLYLIAIYRGASLAIETFLGLPYVWCVVIATVIVTGYTMIGGFKSVVMTDAVQGVLMLLGAVALFWSLLSAGGGMTNILDRLKDIEPSLASWSNTAGLTAAMAYSLAVGVKYLVEPRQLSRFYGLKDSGALKTAAWIAPIAILISYVCLLPLGAMARAVVDSNAITDTDQVIPYLLGPGKVLGPVVGTMFLLVLVSAAMSSIDSVLLVAASTISRDVFRQVEITDDSDAGNQVRQTRIWIVAISLSAAAFALLPYTRDIVKMTKFSGSLYGACFIPVLVIGLYKKKRVAKAAVITMIVGSVTVIGVFILRQAGLTSIQEVYPGIAIGVIVYYIASAVCSERLASEL